MKRDLISMQLDLGHELVIDNFAGGGGTSTGLEAALGRPVDIAINHDPEALAMHAINHPHTRHLCESVWDVDPIAVTGNRPVALVWLSPDCKHFSKAKGGTPVNKNIRGLAWVTLRWAAKCKPRVIMLENVAEFQTWGPLLVDADGNAKPDPAKRGKTYDSFVRQLRAHGYAVETREMRACDFGAPTIRKRFFLIARRDGLPIVWPAPTHGDPDSAAVRAGRLLAWRTAAECIDFDLPSVSIFDRPRPLVANTLRRVAKGLWRHVLTSSKPFLVGAGGPVYAGKPVSLDGPMGTLTTENHRALAAPILAPFIGEHANSSNQRNMPADAPLRTICAQVKGGHFSVVAPMLAPLRGTSEAHLGARDIAAPMSTVSAGGTHHALVAANLIDMGHGEGRDGSKRFSHGVRSLDVPLNTVTASGATSGLVAAHLTHLTHHGERSGYALGDPLRTVTGAHRGEQALVLACLEQANGGFYEGDGRAADQPMSTITAAGSNQRLVTAYCVKYYSSGGQWQGLGEPMHTLPTKARMGLVQAIQVPAAALDPAWSAKAKRCAQLLHEYLPEHFAEPADLVLIGGYVLVDITLRMLKARELFRAQSFPDSYIIHEIPDPALLFLDGVQAAHPMSLPRIPLSGAAQVRMCGNSVAPLQAEAFAAANFGHEQLFARVA